MSARDPLAVTVARARRAMGDFRNEHKPRVRQQRNGFYRAECSCGWAAVHPQQLAREALKGAIGHLGDAADEYAPENASKNGVSLPETVTAPTQDHVTG